MRRSGLAIVSLVLACGILGCKPRDVKSAEFLQKVAAEVNKQMPKMIDPETELTSATGLEGVLVYNYRLVNRLAAELDAEKLVSILKPQITQNACKLPETRDQFLKQGVSLRYSYADKNKAPVASFDVSPADCGF